jgi:hypothetical protein
MTTTGRHLATAADLARVPVLAQVSDEWLRQLAHDIRSKTFPASRVLPIALPADPSRAAGRALPRLGRAGKIVA